MPGQLPAAQGEPSARARVPFPGWKSLDPAPPALPSLLPFLSDSTMISYLKKKIFLPGGSEAINSLLYIMFSYSSRLPLPSTDSL